MVAPNHKLATTGNQNQVKTIGKKYKPTFPIMAVTEPLATTFKNSYHSIADFAEQLNIGTINYIYEYKLTQKLK